MTLHATAFTSIGKLAYLGNLAAIVASFTMGVCQSASADIIHVYEGESIQAAIDGSTDGDEIIVHPGTYNEAIDFIGKAVWLHSSDGQYDTTIDATGLDASVVKCVSGEGLACPEPCCGGRLRMTGLSSFKNGKFMLSAPTKESSLSIVTVKGRRRIEPCNALDTRRDLRSRSRQQCLALLHRVSPR